MTKPSKTDRNILVAFILNLSFSAIELVGGFLTNSFAIVSDAIHDFGDATSIGIAYFLEKKSKQKPDNKYTYGYIRYSVLGAFITTMILLIGSCLVIFGSVNRIVHPEAVNYDGMIIFAIFGVIINAIATYATREKGSINQKSVNLHMAEDVLGWVVVLVGSILMKFTDISLIDPLMSIGVAVFILYNVFKNLKEMLDLFLEKTPSGVSVDELKAHIGKIKGVKNVHHIHVWSLDGYNHFATLHLVTDGQNDAKIKHKVKAELTEHGIGHATIEIENGADGCDDIVCHVETPATSGHHHHHHH